ncbi:MAG TPA: hypothetical protein VFS30_17910 [Dehalococcoidia bacterium]|nr:hypothetical protein [Dehalococcoidia bacterium]
MTEASDSWESRTRVEKLVGQLVELARDETASRVLGVDSVAAEQVDVSFLEDPIDYVAYDLAAALLAADDDPSVTTEVPPSLTMLVAEVKLCQILGRFDEADLVRRTLNNLRE